MIEIEHVRRNYGPTTAVADLNLTVKQGEVFAFLGPNGAGKTTTIKMIVGLLQPSAGAIRVCGHDVVRKARESSACIGYVPDEPHLYDKLTGRELLQFIGEMYGFPTGEVDRHIAREVERFQLGEFVDNLTETYSHGMKQRTVFAAAMLHQPRVLVVDEPMVGLDPHSIRLVKDLLMQQAAGGCTVFMSTHTLSVAEEVADRIGVVHRGRLMFVGTVHELQTHFARPDRTLERLYLDLVDAAEGRASSVENGDEHQDLQDADDAEATWSQSTETES
ncbi:MAG: ABC transporter ATP-binding protein [Pirellulales bacterium]